LGENSGRQPYTADLNEITTIGFWAMPGGNAVNYPDKISYSGYGSLLVERRTDKITQTVKFNGYIATRSSGNNGVSWDEWKYVNPPMEIGVEYRTTERWNGKVVYTCLVNCGSVAGDGVTSTYPNLNITQCISCEACSTAGDSFPVKWVDISDIYVNAYANKTAIHVYTSGGYSTTATIYAKLRYTKD
jgi:hypothetical protein